MLIQLDARGLERLIGGDSEIEVSLRHQIVNEFAKKHLKPLANDETWRRAYGQYATEVTRQIEERLREFNSFVLSRDPLAEYPGGTLKEKIASAVERAVEAAIAAAVNKTVERWKVGIDGHIARAVDRAMEKAISDRVTEEVQRRLKLAMEVKP